MPHQVRVLLAVALFWTACADLATAQSARRLFVYFGTFNQGALGDANRAFAAGAEAFGSYHAYIDGQDIGQVRYGKLTTFSINSNANAFALWEHQPFQKKSVSNALTIYGVGRSRLLVFETVEDAFVFCTNTQTINFNCEAMSKSEFDRLMRGS